MVSLVVYDSMFGNTEKVAVTVAHALETKAVPINRIRPSELKELDLLIIGSPTQGGQASPAMQRFIQEIPDEGLAGVKVAVFDTRFAVGEHGLGLRMLMKIIDFAAPKMERALREKGAVILAPGEGFIVTDKEGPLRDGELGRAKKWAAQFTEKYEHQ